jgi:hypothetical protein
MFQILMEGHLRAGEATRALATWHNFFGSSSSSYGSFSSSSTSSYPKTLPFLYPNTFASNAKLKALAAVCASLPPSHTDTPSSAYDGAGTFHASKSQSERRAGQGGTQERIALQAVAGETKSRVEVLRAALKVVEEMSLGPTNADSSNNIHCAPDTHTLNAALAVCVAFVTKTSIRSLTSTSKSLPSAATTTFSSPSTPPSAAAAKLSRLATTRTLALLVSRWLTVGQIGGRIVF